MPKQFPNIWATFIIKFVARNFQKPPNLVTLQTVDQLTLSLRMMNMFTHTATIEQALIMCEQ